MPNDPTTSVTVGELRTRLRLAARNAGDSDIDDAVYDLAEKDAAISDVLEHFIRETKCTLKRSTIATVADTAEMSFSSIAGFNAARVLAAWIEEEEPLQVVDLFTLLDIERANPTTGAPTLMAMIDPLTVRLWPTPDAVYTINVQWWPGLTTWTLGDEATGTRDLVLNVPRDMAIGAVRTGGVCILQFGEITNIRVTEPGWIRYLQHIRSCQGGNTPANQTFRLPTLRDRWGC